jgi:hypothetical protein
MVKVFIQRSFFDKIRLSGLFYIQEKSMESFEVELTKREEHFISTLGMYSQRMSKICPDDDLQQISLDVLGKKDEKIPLLWVDLVYNMSQSEPENLFNKDIQELVYKKLVEFYSANNDGFSIGLLIGMKYLLQGIRAYLEISEIFREVEPVDQIPEFKTRLYRIPTYSQILESVLSNFLRAIRDICGGIEEKDFSQLSTLGNLRDFLTSRGLGPLFKSIDVDVRNAINHGGIIVSPWETVFIYSSGKNKNKMEKVWTVRDPIGEVIIQSNNAGKPHFDDLIEGSIDDAGGILSGFVKYFCLHPEAITPILDEIRKDEFLANEYLCRLLTLPGWTCSNIDTGIVEGSSQLNIHFYVLESHHGQLMQHSLESAIITNEWIPGYKKYMVGYRHPRMHPGVVLFQKKELEAVVEGNDSPMTVMKKILEDGHFLIPFEASQEKVDVEAVKRHQYPLINGKTWKLREIKDLSLEKSKRFHANLYIPNADSKKGIIESVKNAIHSLKHTENPPSLYSKIKYGRFPAKGVYLHVFRIRSRRKKRKILPSNDNFFCLAEWSTNDCIKLKKGGIPDQIWDQLIHEKKEKILFSWNPNSNF